MGGDFRARVNDGIEAGLMAAAQVCGERDNAAQSYVRHRHLWQKERERGKSVRRRIAGSLAKNRSLSHSLLGFVFSFSLVFVGRLTSSPLIASSSPQEDSLLTSARATNTKTVSH